MTYDHEEVRCEAMADLDCETLLVGSPRTCCVCIGHDCEEARAAIAKRLTVAQPLSGSNDGLDPL